MQYSDVKLQPLRNYRFKVLEEITYKDVTVPAGYLTNGADVPRLFWFIFPPNRTDYLPAVIFHDYLCDLEEYKKADEYFNEIMKELHINKFTRVTMVSSVKIYHLIRYQVKWWK